MVSVTVFMMLAMFQAMNFKYDPVIIARRDFMVCEVDPDSVLNVDDEWTPERNALVMFKFIVFGVV